MPPRLGFWTCLAVGGWLVAYASTWWLDRRSEEGLGFAALWQVGLIYGLVSQGVWLTGAFWRRSLRWGAGSGTVIIGAGLLSVQEVANDRSARWLEEVAHLGGMAVAQSVVFFAFGVASWAFPGGGPSRRPRQYTTLDLALLTVATAVVLSLASRQATPIEPAEYWYVMVGVWIGLPAIAAVSAVAGTAASAAGRLMAGFAAMLMTAAGCGLLVAMEVRYGRFNADQAALLAQFYGSLLAAFLGCCWVLPQAGRLDAGSVSEPIRGV